MKDSRYSVRPYLPGDEYAINELFNTVFDQFRPIEEWEHKFGWLQPDSQGRRAIVVGCVDGRIVGVQAGIPTCFEYREELFQGIQIVDNAILPEHRRFGLQRAMYEHLCDISREQNFFVFGFPGGLNLRAGIFALGWRPRVKLRLWARSMQKSKNSDLNVSGVTCTLGHPGLLCSLRLNSCGSDRIRLQHTTEYMQWRYRNSESTTFHTVACIERDSCLGCLIFGVRKADPNTAMLYEMDFLDTEVGATLLSYAVDVLGPLGLERLSCYLALESAKADWLRRLGFEVLDALPLTLVTSELFTDRISEKIMSDPRSWEITLGDSDRS